MKFVTIIFFAVITIYYSNGWNEDLCTTLRDSGHEIILEKENFAQKKRWQYFSPREFTILTSEIYDTIKTLETHSISGYSNDTTYAYFRYTDDFRLIEEKVVNGDKDTMIYFYVYDSLGNLTNRNNDEHFFEWKYENSKKPISKYSKNRKYFYQEDGQVITEYEVRSIEDTTTYQSIYTSKVKNRFAEDTIRITVDKYDKNGFHLNRSVRFFFPDGRIQKTITENHYDNLGRRSSQIFTKQIGTTSNPISQRTDYTYNDCHILESAVKRIEGAEQFSDATRYEYEILEPLNGQLRIAENKSSGYQTIKTYDKRGNWIHKIAYYNGEFKFEKFRFIEYK